MNRRVPFFAPAFLTVAICVLLCCTLRLSGAGSSDSRVVCRSCLRSSFQAPSALALARLGEGQEVVGQKMPALDFDRWLNTDRNGPVDIAGHVTLYRWWTDGCAHCEKTLPAVERLRRKFGPRGLRVVAVYHPKPPREVTDRFVLDTAKQFGYGGSVALDLDWSELKKFYLSTGDRRATSASFLVGRDGVIRFAHPGPRFYPSEDPADAREDADYRSLEKAIEGLVAAPK